MSARERAALAAAEERPQQALAWALIDLADAVRSLQREPSEAPGPEPRRYLTEEQRAQMTARALERLDQVRDAVVEDQTDEHDPWESLQVGDTPPPLPAKCCTALVGIYACTRAADHSGQHVATGRMDSSGREVLAVSHVHEWTQPHGPEGARQCATCREVTL